MSEVSEAIARQNADLASTLPMGDDRDVEDARRGWLGGLDPAVVRTDSGRVVWDNEAYAFLDAPTPACVNPSLWRQSGLVARHGLYEVVEGIYQVRGLDLSNVTLVEGESGVIVIDPLISTETAAAALDLYRDHRGDRPVRAVVYTHSHADHFGGVKGVTSQERVDAGECVVIAPAGFLEEAVAENVFAGGAMARRAGYMYGAALPRGPEGQVGAGLGATTSTGSVSMIAPTLEITRTGQEEVVDGVRVVFQLTPGTEAPAEMNFTFPDHRAVCLAENASHTLHNLLTLRGAVVRDAHVWARYLTESITLLSDDIEVAFASHHWPTWGHERIVEYLSLQRDLYAYLHDQTLRLLNQGYVGAEIAEMITLPPAVERAWHTRGYYGSVSHNVKAIYQRYLGWFDGNPAHLWEHPPVEQATRYVAAMGGPQSALRQAQDAHTAGDFRWAATVLNHIIFADPGNTAARDLQASTFEQLAYGAENGVWRNFFLTGAHELRHGNVGTPTSTASPDFLQALSVEQLLDSLAIRVDGPRCWDEAIRIEWVLTDTSRRLRIVLANGVLTHHTTPRAGQDLQLELTTDTDALRLVLTGLADPADLAEAGRLSHSGDLSRVHHLFTLLDDPDPAFEIVLP
ncbi:alkyl sulfatase dimerization domain-containing protein [uncultured Serinicoccus sp.]|uniref:alkyl/aryl-sulfatase n=1 Tax=uncultured Serinicoccus sp. TaxID=735514 RepID=UPI00262DC93D|nr:alkyl sulfatase dimerization domain-containing protein [uncultured Serinicoccus sp.]